MPSSSVFLASDVHLGVVSRQREREFIRWLEYAAAQAGELIINGDLFDFWFEYRHAVPRGYSRVLGAIARIVDAGVPVRMMGGNHDWWGGAVLEDEIGVTFHRHPVRLNLAGRTTFLAHGDGLGRGDLGYRALRLLLRGRMTRWAFRWLHPDLGAALARRVSATDPGGECPSPSQRRRAKELESWARSTLSEDPDLDLVVLSHTHLPDLVEVEGRRWYVNTGDWVHHRTFVILEEGERPRLEEWDGSV
jgi:UDP-2,3-diacylglucosamine hydrolase